MRRPDLARFALAAALALASAATLPARAQQRLATDFEIAQMEKQIAGSRGFEAQLGARLNLGDARAARNEVALARAEYLRALELAGKERLRARADSSLSAYANATSWAAVASAKLGRRADALALAEEAVRYASDDAETWNLYASAMRILGYPRKAVAAARNAVAIAERATANPLDVAVYRHALATAYLDAGQPAAAERRLEEVLAALDSKELGEVREQTARLESFEVYSSARGDVAAYVSLLNRTLLRLAAICESRGDLDCARGRYRRVLARRSDDAIALAALARLAGSGAERDRLYAEAFEANPFSPSLVREYRALVQRGEAQAVEGETPGARVRRAIVQLERRELRAARASIDALLAGFPENATLRALRREAEGVAAVAVPSEVPSAAELQGLLNGFERLTPEQRARLDGTDFTSEVRFDPPPVETAPRGGTTVFTSGRAAGVPFRFSTPTAFAGVFDAATPLRLTYRVIGVTRLEERDVLLLEPLRLERAE